jgi:cytochrome c biogenesis protein CcmG, thiol:disulfide interchange protein DsbE
MPDEQPSAPMAICQLVGSCRVLIVVTLAAAVLAGCAEHAHSDAPGKSQVRSAFKGSPSPLASLHARANRLLAGGPRAFKAQLATLRGFPVVVNKWASWCGPCQSEFPVFQKVAVDFGRRVAFIGIDAKDQNGQAASFLRKFPVTYPSYVDPAESIARSIQAATFYPQTIYFDRRGKPVYDHAGAYVDAGALERDIRRYALSSG